MLSSFDVIHTWEPADHLGAISVVREVFDEYGFTWEEEGYHADLYNVPKYYFELGDRFYVARLEDQVVGTAALEFFPMIPGGRGETSLLDETVRIAGTDCSLERLYVRIASRGFGVGGRLFQKVIEEARSAERVAMEIWSDKRFTDAHRLYQRFGAVVIGERTCDDPDESPEWGLRLEL